MKTRKSCLFLQRSVYYNYNSYRLISQARVKQKNKAKQQSNNEIHNAELVSQSKIENNAMYFQDILNTRKKMSEITKTNPIVKINELSDEYVQKLEDSAIEWKKKKDKQRKIYNFTDLNRIINHSSILHLDMPSKQMEHYLNACRIASLLRLDPERDKELIKIKKRIQWICMKHRLDYVPSTDFFLKNRYWDVIDDTKKYGDFGHVVSLIGLKPLVYTANSKNPTCIPSVATVSPFLSPIQQRKEWKKLQNECLKIDLRNYMKEIGKSWLPPRNVLMRHKRFDLERRILKLGGHVAASRILRIPYKQKRSARYWQKLQNVADELKLYYKVTGARSNILPTRLELWSSGFDELGNKLKRLQDIYIGRVENDKKNAKNKKHNIFKSNAEDGKRSLETALSKETDLDLIERQKDYEPLFVENAKRYKNLSRLLQELFLIISLRKNMFNDNLLISDIISSKRYDVAFAIEKYHGGYNKIKTLFPNPPKALSYWDDIDNVAKEIRHIMRIFNDQQFFPHSTQLTYSGNSWLRECIYKHGGFDFMAEYIHAETNFDQILDDRDDKEYWNNIENVYDELMTFIYNLSIDYMPSKLELLACGYSKLWDSMCIIAQQEYQTRLIKLKTKELKQKFKGNYLLSKESESESVAGNAAAGNTKDLVIFDKEYYTEEFEKELNKILFKLKESAEFNKILSETEVLHNISYAFKIPTNKEFEGHCDFVLQAEKEWKDFGCLAKELMAFYCFYTETCFTLNREFIDNFVLPSIEDIAYCLRSDLNYAILRWHGGHNRVQNRIRGMRVIDLYHPLYGEGKSADEILYLEHGTIWQFKALPPPPLTNANLLIGKDIDPMFLPEALPTKDMINPTQKVINNKYLRKKIKKKKVTLLVT